MAHSDHGIVKDAKAEDQPKDKQRARTAHSTKPDKSVSKDATRDPEPGDSNPGSGHAKRRA